MKKHNLPTTVSFDMERLSEILTLKKYFPVPWVEQRSMDKSLPWETRTTLCIILLITRCHDCGSKKPLAVLVPSAYLVTSFGELLWRAGDAAVVLIFGAVSTCLQQHTVTQKQTRAAHQLLAKENVHNLPRWLCSTKGEKSVIWPLSVYPKNPMQGYKDAAHCMLEREKGNWSIILLVSGPPYFFYHSPANCGSEFQLLLR